MNEFFRELSEVAKELAKLQASVAYAEKTQTDLDEFKNRINSDLSSIRERIAVLEATASERKEQKGSAWDALKFWLPFAVTAIALIIQAVWFLSTGGKG